VKIAPRYAQSVVHVNDASRAVGVVSSLLDADRKRDARRRQPRAAGAPALRPRGRRERPLLALDAARANRFALATRPGRLLDAGVPRRARAPT
jgi:5-methyltetrahydrofolate--homocysteine methyltransferase